MKDKSRIIVICLLLLASPAIFLGILFMAVFTTAERLYWRDSGEF